MQGTFFFPIFQSQVPLDGKMEKKKIAIAEIV